MKKIKNVFLLLRMAFSSRKNFKNFFLAYVILRFELIRNIIIRCYQLWLGKSVVLAKVYQNRQLASSLNQLKKEGYVILDKTLSEAEVECLKHQVAHLSCIDNYNPSVGTYKLEEAPSSVNIAGYASSELVKIPEVLQLANDPEILALVQEYLGCRPTLTTIQMWWSLVGRSAPQHAQLFHRDFDGLKFVKLFVYLTDVTEDDGPHLYVAGSVHSKKMRRPTRLSDETVTKAFPATAMTKMCGKKGMLFLEDTFGIHKGTLPILNNRLLLQMEYGIHPIVYEKYQPLKMEPLVFDSYVNRLYLV